jgi:hypothetical protein
MVEETAQRVDKRAQTVARAPCFAFLGQELLDVSSCDPLEFPLGYVLEEPRQINACTLDGSRCQSTFLFKIKTKGVDFTLVLHRGAMDPQSAGKAEPVARDLLEFSFCVFRDTPVWVAIFSVCPFFRSTRHRGLFNCAGFIEIHSHRSPVHDARGAQEHGARSSFFRKMI